MKNFKLLSLFSVALFSTASLADLSCADRGYNEGSINVNTTSDWVAVISGQTAATYTDGTITGVDAISYLYSLKNWNNTYKSQWCSSYESSVTSGFPPYGVPYPVSGTFSCSWVDEPTTSSDVTTIINVKYCKTKGFKFKL
jgi:hypothetical protein